MKSDIDGWGPPESEEELGALERVLQECFAIPHVSWRTWFERIGREHLRVARRGGRVIGGLGVYRMGQFWGGRAVPLGGVAGVGIAPDARGAGLAREMMARTLRELAADGVPLAALYASTASLYRGVGFGQAGVKIVYEAPLASLPRGEHELACTPVDPKGHARFAPAYDGRARRWNGHLERSEAIWRRIVEPHDLQTLAYVVGRPDDPSAYVVYAQRSTAGIHYEVGVRDWAWSTRADAQRLVALLSDLRSLADTLVWNGVGADPFVSLLPEQTARVRSMERWMLRIVDVPAALQARGYPPIDAELHLRVVDDLLPENAGPWILQIARGVGRVTRGGRGELAIDADALAALYAGFESPQALRARSALRSEDGVLAAVSAAFAGPEPWLCDHF